MPHNFLTRVTASSQFQTLILYIFVCQSTLFGDNFDIEMMSTADNINKRGNELADLVDTIQQLLTTQASERFRWIHSHYRGQL